MNDNDGKGKGNVNGNLMMMKKMSIMMVKGKVTLMES